MSKQCTEAAELGRMLDEIEATESGAAAVRQARAQGWRIGYG